MSKFGGDQFIPACDKVGLGAIIGRDIGEILGRAQQPLVFRAGNCHHLTHFTPRIKPAT